MGCGTNRRSKREAHGRRVILEELLPSGKHTKNYGKIHHVQWVNPLEIVIFNSYVAMLNYQRVHVLTIFSGILNHTKPLKTCVVQGK